MKERKEIKGWLLLYYSDPQKNLLPKQAPIEVLTFCCVLTQGCKAPA